MPLETGYRFCTAPRFANGLPWNERLQVDTGRSQIEAGSLASLSWRAADDSERSILVAEETSDEIWRQAVCLFAIPEHLRARWWEMAARQVEKLPDRLEGMEPFARAILDFAQFKGIPLPEQCGLEVTLTKAGKLEALSAANPSAPMTARVNLGDERSALIFLNLPSSRVAELLDGKRRAREATPENAVAFVGDFLAHFPNYPLVRLFLDPGEGVCFPNADVIHGPDGSGKADIDVWLILREG